MIRHTVLFRIGRSADGAADASALATVEDALRTFAAEPPLALGPAEVTRDTGTRPEGPSVAELSFVAEFANLDDFRAYVSSPEHQRLATEVLVPHCDSWLSLQTEV